MTPLKMREGSSSGKTMTKNEYKQENLFDINNHDVTLIEQLVDLYIKRWEVIKEVAYPLNRCSCFSLEINEKDNDKETK